jgi:exonuclease VII large subunit
MSQEKIFTVSEYLDHLNKTLKPCWAIVRGEVAEKMSNYPSYSFFNLLDKKDGSILKCFTWKGVVQGQSLVNS